MRSLGYLVPAMVFLLASPAPAAAAVWGSFDATRVNYAGGVLGDGAEHDTLRGLITGNGDLVAATTPTLTQAYLDGVDVFYTSLLLNNGSALDADEQDALAAFLQDGGTLIVTADIFSFPFYDSFTQPYGVTGYVATNAVSATPVAAHPLTAGVVSLAQVTQSTFTFGADALELYEGNDGSTFMIVLEPSTGFCSGGRILVIGDHNIFTDGTIGNADNVAAASNIVTWASSPPGVGCDCGNGVLDPGEACDDGDDDNTDDCPGSCQPAACGDGYVQAGVEDCDDGDLDDGDACTSQCVAATCGDGFVQVDVEACDDGDLDDGDACPSTCELAACGDGFVFVGFEGCDDANDVDGDGCSAQCQLEGGESSSGGEGSSSGEGSGASTSTGSTGSDEGSTGLATGTTDDGGPADTSSDGPANGEVGTITTAESTGLPESTTGPDGASGEGGGGTDDGSGCSCDTGPRGLPRWWAAALLLGLGRRRRRAA